MVGGISGVGSFGMGSVGAFYQSRLSENIRSARSAQQAQEGRQGQVWAARKSPSLETPVEPVQAARPISRDEASLPELTARLENDPAAMAGRMRTRYGEVRPDGLFVETGKEGLSPVDGSRKSALEGQLFQAEDALARNDLKGAEDALKNGAPKADETALPGLPGQEEAKPSAIPGQKEETTPGGTAQGAESAQEALQAGECETCESRKYQDGSDDMGVSFQTPTNIKPEQAASAVRGHEMEHVVREQAKADREGRKVVSQNVTMHTEICPECGKSYVSGGTTRTVTKANSGQQADQQTGRQDPRVPFSAVA